MFPSPVITTSAPAATFDARLCTSIWTFHALIVDTPTSRQPMPAKHLPDPSVPSLTFGVTFSEGRLHTHKFNVVLWKP
jgi:hypothetical protein